MELLKPDLGLMFWTTLVFMAVFFILKKFAWKPILSALHDREKSIEDSLKAAERARMDMSNMKSEHERLLNEAKEERAKLLNEARQMKDQIIAEAKDKAKTEFSRIVETAKTEIQNQKMAAMIDVKNEIGNMVLEVSSKILKRELKDKSSQMEHINMLINDAKKSELN